MANGDFAKFPCADTELRIAGDYPTFCYWFHFQWAQYWLEASSGCEKVPRAADHDVFDGAAEDVGPLNGRKELNSAYEGGQSAKCFVPYTAPLQK